MSMLPHLRHALPVCVLVLVTGCGGGTTSDTTTNTTTDTPYTGNCGLGTAAYALESGSSTATSPSFTVSGEQDRSAFCAQNSGTAITLITPTIISSATTSSDSDSNLYGLSASVLAYGSSATTTSGGSITISGGTISTTTGYANAVFATGLGANVTLSKVDISTSGDYAHAVVATKAGAATVTGTTSTHASLTSVAAEVVVLEGASAITINNGDLLSTNANDNRGILIYDSATSSGAAELNITGGSYIWSSSSTSGSAFYVLNQTTSITLKGVDISSPSTSALLRVVAGTSGSKVTLNAIGQTLSGSVMVDADSSAILSLASMSSLTGAINGADTAGSVMVTLDATSTWTLTTNSYVTVLNDTAGISGTAVSNIVGNGHNAYYKSSSNSSLGGATYALSGGGSLIPY
jgi:hypothetical protein